MEMGGRYIIINTIDALSSRSLIRAFSIFRCDVFDLASSRPDLVDDGSVQRR